jgi:cation/acetate symporter
MRGLFGVTRPVELWWGIQPISAGVFGVPVGFAVILVVSCLTRRPETRVMDLVDHVRYPGALPLRPEKR